jgi:hypothetical protein
MVELLNLYSLQIVSHPTVAKIGIGLDSENFLTEINRASKFYVLDKFARHIPSYQHVSNSFSYPSSLIVRQFLGALSESSGSIRFEDHSERHRVAVFQKLDP